MNNGGWDCGSRGRDHRYMYANSNSREHDYELRSWTRLLVLEQPRVRLRTGVARGKITSTIMAEVPIRVQLRVNIWSRLRSRLQMRDAGFHRVEGGDYEHAFHPPRTIRSGRGRAMACEEGDTPARRVSRLESGSGHAHADCGFPPP